MQFSLLFCFICLVNIFNKIPYLVFILFYRCIHNPCLFAVSRLLSWIQLRWNVTPLSTSHLKVKFLSWRIINKNTLVLCTNEQSFVIFFISLRIWTMSHKLIALLWIKITHFFMHLQSLASFTLSFWKMMMVCAITSVSCWPPA